MVVCTRMCCLQLCSYRLAKTQIDISKYSKLPRKTTLIHLSLKCENIYNKIDGKTCTIIVIRYIMSVLDNNSVL